MKLGKGDVKFLIETTLTVVIVGIMVCWFIDYCIILSNQFKGLSL